MGGRLSTEDFIDVIRALVIQPNDYKALYKWGTALLEHAKAVLKLKRGKEGKYNNILSLMYC